MAGACPNPSGVVLFKDPDGYAPLFSLAPPYPYQLLMPRAAIAKTIPGADFSAARQGPTATRRQHLAQRLTNAGQLMAAHYLGDGARAAYFVSDCCRPPRQPALPRLAGKSPRLRYRRWGLFIAQKTAKSRQSTVGRSYQRRCRALRMISDLELTSSLRYTCRMCERTVSRLRCRRSARRL